MELSGGSRGGLTHGHPAERLRIMIRCLVDGPGRGCWNMALDEALMESARSGAVTLRFYGWHPGCLSFGRNQAALGRYDAAAARARGVHVVRRPTGGRAVYHDREVTYSVTAPADAWGSLKDAYARVNRALAEGLRRLGVPASVATDRSGRRAPRPVARACFQDPLPGEVMAHGRKLIGSAQWRRDGALLQHGSILLHNDQQVVDELRAATAAALKAVPAASLAELLPALPGVRRLTDALVEGFAEVFGDPVVPGSPTPKELARARELSARYADDAWTWRR